MSKLLFALLIVTISSFCYSQNVTDIQTQKIEFGDDRSQEWQVYLSNLDYKIEYRFISCDPSIGYDQEFVIFRFTNRTREELIFNWHILSDYNEVCKTCDYPEEYSYGVTVKALQEEEGTCSLYEEPNLKVFSRFIDANYTKGEQLTGFQLGSLTLERKP